jgi:hypothetical protein
MWEPREPSSVIAAAEQAAAAGNYASAEALLREAARLQETTLGPLHPDLANTLNNLGVVCEITKKPADAEQCFRRAVTIATTALDHDHPFVVTSRKNLHDFCEARGKPVDLPSPAPAPTVTAKPEAPAPAATAKPEAPATAATAQAKAQATAATAKPQAPAAPIVSPSRDSHAKPKDFAPADSKKVFKRFALGVLGPIAMLMVVLSAGLPRLTSIEPVESTSVVASASAPDIPAVPPAPLSAEPAPVSVEPAPAAPVSVEPAPAPEPEPVTTPTESRPDKADTTRVTAASTIAKPTIVKAQLCADLDDWHCDPPDQPVPSGPLFFYTQLKSARTITVLHRWYQNDRLHQTVKLRIPASQSGGYRTYSRTTLNGASVGNWRVELRTEDGVVLHEERFTVE